MSHKHTLDELNHLSREELVTIILTMQGQLETLNENIEKLIEQVRIANQHCYGRKTETMQSIVRRHFKWSSDCTVAANKNLPIKAVTHTACGKKRHAFFLHKTGKAV